MNGFSSANRVHFAEVRWSRVLAMLAVLRDSQVRTQDYLARRYRMRATHFNETVDFLRGIGLLSVDGAGLLRPAACVPPDGHGDGLFVLERIITSDCPYRRELVRYLGHFRNVSGVAVFIPDPDADPRESAVRNFLMELEVVKYDPTRHHYTIASDHVSFYARALACRSGLTPANLMIDLQRRADIGLKAELAVLQLERRRVVDMPGAQIEHVSLVNAAAGYDILSIVGVGQGREIRHIEVKAVSETSHEFYWTRGEVEMAEVLGPCYYLYLVPIAATGEVCAEDTLVLPDACKMVLARGGSWIIERDVLRCRPALRAGASRIENE